MISKSTVQFVTGLLSRVVASGQRNRKRPVPGFRPGLEGGGTPGFELEVTTREVYADCSGRAALLRIWLKSRSPSLGRSHEAIHKLLESASLRFGSDCGLVLRKCPIPSRTTTTGPAASPRSFHGPAARGGHQERN